MTHQTLVTCHAQTGAFLRSYNPYNPKLRLAIVVIMLINLDSRILKGIPALNSGSGCIRDSGPEMETAFSERDRICALHDADML